MIADIGYADITTTVALTIVTMISSSIDRYISNRNWRRSVIADLELYEMLKRHSKGNGDDELAESVRKRAFRRVKRRSFSITEIPKGLIGAILFISEYSFGFKIALIESVILILLSSFAAGRITLPLASIFILPFGLIIDVALHLSDKREDREPEYSKEGGDREPNEREHDEEH